ncbi:MAG: 4-alpha-glucanotransferase, partial [Pseudomonadota bacterium]
LPAEYVIFPVQDIIGLDDSARINAPGTIGSPNWEWKLVNFDQLRIAVTNLAQQIIATQRA